MSVSSVERNNIPKIPKGAKPISAKRVQNYNVVTYQMEATKSQKTNAALLGMFLPGFPQMMRAETNKDDRKKVWITMLLDALAIGTIFGAGFSKKLSKSTRNAAVLCGALGGLGVATWSVVDAYKNAAGAKFDVIQSDEGQILGIQNHKDDKVINRKKEWKKAFIPGSILGLATLGLPALKQENRGATLKDTAKLCARESTNSTLARWAYLFQCGLDEDGDVFDKGYKEVKNAIKKKNLNLKKWLPVTAASRVLCGMAGMVLLQDMFSTFNSKE